MSPRSASRPSQRQRPLGQLLAVAALAGMLAAGAVGAFDALYSWRAAAQFAPGLATRLRFVAYVAATHAVAGGVIGVSCGGAVAALRATRLGDMLRFGVADHAARRARDPRLAVAGLTLVVALLPCLAAALWLAFRWTMPFLATRKAMDLVVVVAMG